MVILPCEEFACTCLGFGHWCACGAANADSCVCLDCEVCGKRTPDVIAGIEDGDDRIICTGCADEERAAP